MVNIPKSLINDKSSWLSSDLNADLTWIFRFSAEDMEELLVAVNKVKESNLSICGFGRDDFVLLNLRKKIDKIINEVENGLGVVLWRGLDLKLFDEEQLKILYLGLGVHLGTPIFQASRVAPPRTHVPQNAEFH